MWRGECRTAEGRLTALLTCSITVGTAFRESVGLARVAAAQIRAHPSILEIIEAMTLRAFTLAIVAKQHTAGTRG